MVDAQGAHILTTRGAAAAKRLLYGLGLAFVALTFSACSGCGDDEDKCEGVTCERGVCSADSGRCINASDCGGEDTKCIDGYSCTAANACQADYACTGTGQGSCASGECVAGACVNKDSCATDIDCAPGNFCGDAGTCESDPCTDGTVTCDRGVCEKGTGQCINEVVCTTENEQAACIEGYKCSAQKCVSEQEFCAQQTCDRGVCDFDNLGCADATDCGGDDTKCLDGKYCTDQNTCAANQCDANMTTCPRGECDRSTGQCVDKESCGDSDDCLDGKLCVGTTCVEQDKACGDAGCPGNQLCTYDAPTRTAVCDENLQEGCSSAIDCADDRICRGGACTPPVACEADAYEPNDSTGEVTAYQVVAQNGVVNGATVCSGNKDYFTYNTRDDAQTLGRLVAEININPQDVGLGTLNLELFDKNGNSVNKVVADASGRARIETDVTVITQGDFVVAVGDEGDVKTSGVRYTLYVDVIDNTVVQACQNAQVLTSGVSVNSSTLSGASTALTSSCGDAQGTQSEDIYAIVVAAPSYVTVSMTPDAAADLSVSLRSECLRNGSELAGACSERGGLGVAETFGALLSPGTYYAVVQGETAGFYDITATVEPAICSSADDSCKNATTASVCNERGTAFVDEACDTGCNMATGRCNRPAGDVCVEAIVVTQGQPFLGQVEWSKLRNDYNVAPNGCIGSANPATSGPDVSFKVDVPAGFAVSAKLASAGQDVSLYAVTSCGDVNNSCQVGVDASTSSDEELLWINPNATTTTVYVIADIKNAESYQDSGLTVDLVEVICTPGQGYCTTDALGDPASHVCNASGTGYENLTTCKFDCDMATGLCNKPTNETCDGAIALTAGVPVTGTITDYTADYPLTSPSCVGGSSSGKDAIYKVTLAAGEILDLELDASFDSTLWISPSCDAMSQALGACLLGADEEILGAPEVLTYRAPTAGDYFIVVAAYSASGNGTYTLTADVRTPQCTPGQASTCKDATTLQYCDQLGFFQDYACAGGCNLGACGMPTGNVCVDAVALAGPTGTLTDQSWTGAGNNLEIDAVQFGACFQDDAVLSSGPDKFYRFDLQAGDLLTVDVTTTLTSAFAQLFTDCNEPLSCVDNLPRRGSGQLTYYAQTAGPVFLIMDTSSTTTSLFSLSWSITQGQACAPDSTYCVDANTVARCDGTGAGNLFQATCANGCESGFCKTDLANADTCAAAVAAADVGAGIAVVYDYSDLTNSVNMATPNCTGRSTPGNDAFYKVVLQPGEVLHASAVSHGGEEPVVYAIKDCADPVGTCVGGDGPTNGVAEMYYLNQTQAAETLLVGADTTLSSYDEPFIFIIEKLAPQCQPGAVSCNVDGQTLQLCNSFGLYEYYSCNGTCTGSSCDTPSGDICVDAFALTGTSGQATGDFAVGTNNLEYAGEQVGGCYMDNGDQNDGRDTFYTIQLNAGDVFTASLTTTSTTAYMFFTEGSCADARTNCVKNNPNFGNPTLRYFAAQATQLNVVIDNTSTSTTSTPYTLNWRVDSGLSCAPGEFRCVDATTLGKCAGDGLTESQITCAAGCANDACALDVANGDTCSAALAATDVGQGISVVADYDQLTNDVDMASGSCAGGQQTDGNDLLYKVVLQPGEILHAWVDSYGDEDPLVYAFTDCADPAGTCVAGDDETGTSNRAEIYYANSTMLPQTLIVGADGEYNTADELFGFFIEKRAPECQPGTRMCAVDGQTLQLCNGLGLYDRYVCNGTCTVDACDMPSGDICFDAFALTGTSGQITGAFDQGTNQFQLPTGRQGGCVIEPTYENDGPEQFYNIRLNAGDVFTAELVTGSTSAQLFFLDGCSGNDFCLLNNAPRHSDVMRYHAQAPMTLTMVVDSTFSSATTYTVNWRVDSGLSCAPGEYRCLDAMTLGICGADGLTEASSLCAAGCDVNACAPDVANSDTCVAAAAATDIGAGIAVYAEYGDFTNDVDMPASACTGDQTDGPDSMYKITLQPGEIMFARAESYDNDYPHIFVIKDCMDPAGSCVAGASDLNGGDVAEVFYVNQTQAAETLIVGVDSDYSFATGFFALFIEKRAPECAGATITCDPNNNTRLRSCNQYGLYEYFDCNGGCANDACVNPSGEVCVDAIALTGATGQVTGDFQGGQDFDPGYGRFGGCFVDSFDNPDGGDTFYRVDLQAGDVFTAKLTTNSTLAHMFLFDDCGGANSCVKNLPFQGNGTISYYAPVAKSMVLVVDNSSTFTTATDTYTVDYTISSGGACAADQFRCVDATTLGKCSADGLTESLTTCVAGCSDGACNDNTVVSDLCADTFAGADVGQGIAVYSTYAEHTNNIDMSSSSCVGQQTDGNDTFYKVILQPGEILHAWVDSYGDNDPQIYAIKDCADPENTCVAGAPEFGLTNRAEIYYTNTSMAAETLIVAADGEFSTSTEPFGMFIEKLAPQCQPGSQPVCAGDGTTLLTCNQYGLYDRYACNGGCVANACVNPSGDVCFDSIPLSGATGQVTGTFNKSNSYVLSAGQTGGCFIDDFDENDESDTFYSVQLNAGEVLTATLSSLSTTSYLFMLADCTDPRACLKNNPQRGNTTLSHYAQTAQTIYLVVDSSAASTQTYTLDYNITTGAVCAPGEFRCVDATTLGQCSDDGLMESQLTCTAGCEFGACKPDIAVNDSCVAAANAPDIGDGIAVYADYDQLTNDIDIPSTACVGTQTDGQDLFYKVVLQPGEVLHAWVDSYGDEPPLVFAFEDCADPAGTCAVGARETGSTNRAELFHANQTAAAVTLIVAADNEFNTADENFGFFIERLQPQCTPNTAVCDANGQDLLTCNVSGIYQRSSCALGCNNGACNLPQNDTCGGAIALTSGVAEGGIIDVYQSDYPQTSTACTGFSVSGKDALYKVTLNAGQSVDVDMTSSFDGALWISNSCTLPATIGACVAGVDDVTSNSTESLTFTAPTAGDYFIVVAAYSATGAGSYSVVATVR